MGILSGMAVDRRELAAVFAGGALGTLGRAGFEELAAPDPGHWPWPTFIVNIVGAFLLGVFVTRLLERLPLSSYRRPFLGTGICGGLTTFSTMQVETLKMVEHGHYGLAAGYIAASIAAGLVAVYVGTALIRRARCPPRTRRAIRSMTAVLVWVGVCLLGGLGAVTRFTVDKAISRRAGGSFPYGTLVVNISGALLLGFFAGLALPPHVALVAGTGFVGSYTTFSTWMFETHRLAEERQLWSALGNIVVSVALGLSAAFLGQTLGALCERSERSAG